MNKYETGQTLGFFGGGLKRREFLQIGGIGLTAYAMRELIHPMETLAQANVNTLSTADAVIFIKLAGAPSHLDTFDIKEGPWTPADFDIQTKNGITLPNKLFPNLLNQSDKFSIIHSVQAWVPVHAIGQYWLDTSQDFNAALANERPALGAVIAMEYQDRRGPDDVLPGFVTLIGTPAGGNGFLNGMVAPFPISGGGGTARLVPTSGVAGLTHPRGQDKFNELWDFVQQIDAPNRGGSPPWGKPVQDYDDFYQAAKGMTYNPNVAPVFQYTDEERAAYGNSQFGDALIVARNLVKARKGTRFVHVTLGSWDMHQNIYSPTTGLYRIGSWLDNGLASLIGDLAQLPGTRPGQSLLDTTLIVVMGEFGRTPPSVYQRQRGADLNAGNGRDHYPYAQFTVMAGGGVIGGRNIGVTDRDGTAIIDPGWAYGNRGGQAGPNIRMEDIGVTIYSAMGINWTKEIQDTPSRRVYQYINGGPNTVYKEVRELFK